MIFRTTAAIITLGLVITGCAIKKPADPRVAKKFRIGNVRVIAPSLPGSAEVERAIHQSFVDVIRAYGPGDASLPKQDIAVKLKHYTHRDRAFMTLAISQIRGQVVFGNSGKFPNLRFNYSEDPQNFWRINISGNSKAHYNRTNTFTRLGRLLALSVVGSTRGLDRTLNGSATGIDKQTLKNLNSTPYPTTQGKNVKRTAVPAKAKRLEHRTLETKAKPDRFVKQAQPRNLPVAKPDYSGPTPPKPAS